MFKLDAKETIIDRMSEDSEETSSHTGFLPEAQAIIDKPSEKSVSGAVIVGVAQFIEAALLLALGLVIYWLYVLDGSNALYVPVILGSVLAANIMFNIAGTHSVSAYRSYVNQVGRVLAAWSLIFLLLIGAAFLFRFSEEFSRVWMVSWYGLGAVILVLFRLLLRAAVQHWTRVGRLKMRTVIVGGGETAQTLIETLSNGSSADIEILGLFDDRDDDRSPEQVSGHPKLGTVDDLIQFARVTKVDLVIVSMPLSAEDRVLHMLKRLWVLPVDIRLSAHMSKLQFTRSSYSYVGDVAMFDMADRPITDWNLIYKWLFDRIVALSALILLSPIMIATAIAVRLESKGPILFKQKRHGFNNELIEIYKFRSMYTDQSDVAATKLVTKDDPRVTKVGKFIRKTSIDELPQIFNVLKGELSIVGPRPHALEAKAANHLYHDAVDGYFARHKVKPGMTGWAQVHGWRGETDTLDKIMQRVNHDLYYIENWTPLLDIYIVFLTPFSLFSKNENAY